MDLHKRALKEHGKDVIALLDRNWEKRKEHFITNYFTKRIAHDLSGLPDKDHLTMEELSLSRFLYGKQGVGKTVEACRLMLQHYKESLYMGEWKTMPEGHKVKERQGPFTYKFTSLVQFYTDIQESFNNKESSKKVFNAYKNVNFLILDDMGKEKVTAWASMMFFKLINDRHNDMLQTIATSNFNLALLQKKGYIDPSLRRRLEYFEVGLVPHYKE